MATRTTPCDETGNPYSATNPLPTSGAVLTGDIEIGAVEIKDGVADIRQTVLAASTAAAATDKAAVVDLSPNGVVGAAGDAASLTGSLNAKLRAIATALGITALDLGSGTGGSRTLRWFMDTAQWIGGTGVVGTAVQRVTLATDVALPAGTALLGKVGIDQTTPGADSVSVKTNGFDVTVTPTVTNGAYSAGDIVGDVMTFSLARANDEAVIIDRVQVTVKAAVTSSLTLVLFNASPSGTTTTDNAAYSLVAADAFKVIASIPFAALGGYLVDHGTPNTYDLGNLQLTCKPVSGAKTVLALLIDGTGWTLTSTSDVQVRISGRGV